VQSDAKFTTGDFTGLENPLPSPGLRPSDSAFAAVYFPWLQVFDPGMQLSLPGSEGLIYVPPSGYVAGIWARSDANRGVFKAPANEVVQGAIDVQWTSSIRWGSI
jgi:hypothetical protein